MKEFSLGGRSDEKVLGSEPGLEPESDQEHDKSKNKNQILNKIKNKFSVVLYMTYIITHNKFLQNNYTIKISIKPMSNKIVYNHTRICTESTLIISSLQRRK